MNLVGKCFSLVRLVNQIASDQWSQLPQLCLGLLRVMKSKKRNYIQRLLKVFTTQWILLSMANQQKQVSLQQFAYSVLAHKKPNNEQLFDKLMNDFYQSSVEVVQKSKGLVGQGSQQNLIDIKD